MNNADLSGLRLRAGQCCQLQCRCVLSPGSAGSEPPNCSTASSLHLLPACHGGRHCPSPQGNAGDRQEQSGGRLSLTLPWQGVTVGKAAGEPQGSQCWLSLDSGTAGSTQACSCAWLLCDEYIGALKSCIISLITLTARSTRVLSPP